MLKFASKRAHVASKEEEEVLEEITEQELNDGIELNEDDFESSAEEGEGDISAAAAPPAQQAQQPQRRGFFSSFFGSSGEASAPSAAQSAPAPPPPVDARKKPRRKPRAERKVVAKQRVTANVAAIDFASLTVDAPQCSVSPFSCNGCTALLTSLSKLEAAETGSVHENNTRTWTCEFCGLKNDVPSECAPDSILSDNSTVDFVLEPPPSAVEDGELEEGEGQTGGSTGDPFVYFAVDTSGSMALTQNVPGLTADMLDGGDDATRKAQIQAEISELEGLKQAIPSDEHAEINRLISRLRAKLTVQVKPRRRVQRSTHVSRLAAVRMALQQQVDSIAKEQSSMRIGLLTFANNVCVHGDSETVLQGDDTLGDEHQLRALASDLSDSTKRIGDEGALENFKRATAQLRPSGRTALGPALVTAIEMASTRRGSKVVICTDGVANVGVGRLDNGVTDEVEEFYESVGDWAAVKGVSVDVVTLADEECRVEQLGIVADRSGGRVNRVDLARIREGFKDAASVPVATGVEVTILCHQALKISLQEETAQQEDLQEVEGNRVTRQLGNVTRDAKFFFEYGVNAEAMRDDSNAHLSQIPFQIQVRFTRTDGARVMRVIAAQQEVTHNAEEAQNDCDISLLVDHVAQRSAALAQEGDYEQSRLVNLANANFLRRLAQTEEHKHKVSQHITRSVAWDTSLRQEQQREQAMPLAASGLGGSKAAKKKMRARRRNDALASQMYAMKKSGY
ncbi:MAG: hypothetical protein MHM6MM_003857 [Cercozoa sp. M6MM]